MTLIARHGNDYYCDTKILTGEGEFAYSMDYKIRALLRPIEIVHSKLKLKDVIYGYAFTGARDQAFRMVAWLYEHQNIEDVIMAVNLVDQFKMINITNLYEVVFIGEKADYAIRMGGESEILKVYMRGDSQQDWSMGGGSEVYRSAKKNKGIDPVRAMISAFTQDTNSGGAMERWSLVDASPELFAGKVKGKVFLRTGIFNKRTRKIFDLCAPGGSLEKSKLTEPLEADMILNPRSVVVREPVKRIPKVPKLPKTVPEVISEPSTKAVAPASKPVTDKPAKKRKPANGK